MKTLLARPKIRRVLHAFNWTTFARSFPWLTLALGLSITFLVWRHEKQLLQHEEQARFQALLAETGSNIKERMRIYEQVLRGAQGLFASTGMVTREQFRLYAEKLALAQNYPGIQGVGFALAIAPEQRAAHIEQVRAEGFPKYDILPSGQRAIYTSVLFLEPFSVRNQRAFGYDMYADRGQRQEAMDLARDQNRVSISGIVTLQMEIDANVQPGFLMYLPVYKNGRPIATVAQRRAALQGWMYAPFRVHDLMQGILRKGNADIAIQVYDGSEARPQKLMYHGSAGADFTATRSWQNGMAVDVANRKWSVVLQGMPARLASHQWDKAQQVAAIGAAMSVLLAFITGLLAKMQIQALKVTEAMRLSSLVYQNSNQGMVVTDARGMIVSVNPAFTVITGYEEDDVLGQQPRIWKSGRHDSEFYRTMWQSLQQNKQWQGEIWNRRKSGEIFAEYLVLNAILNREGKVDGYVCLYSDLTEKKRSDELIWKQINFDSLTGYPNRHMLQDRMAIAINRFRVDQAPFAFLLIDLDNFNNINDTLGHHVGDLLLVELAHRLAACIGEADTLARFGGDEFAIIYQLGDERPDAASLAQQIISGLTASFSVQGETVFATVSIGITFYPQEAENVADILKNADQALFRAKHGGRNRFACFTPEMQLAAQERLALEKDLRHALERRQLIVYFQPIVDLATGNIFKAEALLRWQHPERGMISPAKFIPLAEESGLINPIGDWVFTEAAKWSRRWSQLLGRTFQVSVSK